MLVAFAGDVNFPFSVLKGLAIQLQGFGDSKSCCEENLDEDAEPQSCECMERNCPPESVYLFVREELNMWCLSLGKFDFLRVETVELEDCVAESEEQLQGHQHAVLPVDAEATVGHGNAEIHDVLARDVVYDLGPPMTKNPRIKNVLVFDDRLAGVVLLPTAVSHE